VRQALEDLGIDEARAAKLGLRFAKVGLVWPLSPETVRQAARGLDVLIVVEEKRGLIEPQVREALYGMKAAPAVIGKQDENGRELFPAWGTLEPNAIAAAIGARLLPYTDDKPLAERLAAVRATIGSARNAPDLAQRIPYFCAGCPHNSSTVVPEGGRGYAGIGCHWMVQFIPSRHTEGATHMGGEGANWIGEAPFSKRDHVFQNMGDGTYNHSGLMAVRAACASGVNITYKILFNDAVAMTGGQSHDTRLSPEVIAAQVRAEGVERIAVVSDEPEKYQASRFPPHVTFHHRDDIQPVQEELMTVKGVSALIYDQTCAAEKRRRRKRGAFPDPARRVFINELVCEGCGDCGVKSNCVAIAPVETSFGRKRQIDQSVCNKDFSCLKGFCPSFVTVEGGELIRGVMQKPAETSAPFPVLPEPVLPGLARPWSILVTGIGGTGVVTVGHILGMAAHLEGKGTGLIDMAGLSQKNGAVVTHVKIARRPEEISAIRIAAGGADVILGCDLVTSASERILSTADRARTAAVVNEHETMPAQFTRDADFRLPGEGMRLRIEAACDGRASFFDATALATELLGDSIAANLMTLGYAWQKGLVPLSHDAIVKAIALNGAAVKMNTEAFLWGRRAAHDPAAVSAVLGARARDAAPARETLDEMIARRRDFLTAYQNPAYAAQYVAFLEKVRAAEAAADPASQALSDAVARYLFKLMAYKDEYEVARLYTDGAFEQAVRQKFTGDFRLNFHLAPPLLSGRDAEGHLKKRSFGSWMMPAFRVLARLRGLRGTAFDPFGYTAERKIERALIGEYRATVEGLLANLGRDRLALAAEIAAYPETIRGYGHVKERHLAETRTRLDAMLARWRSGAGEPVRQAAE
jgi:indolepyruvate ferredoxin oxidoreductase